MPRYFAAVLGIALAVSTGAAQAQRVFEADISSTSFSRTNFATVEARRAATPLPFPVYSDSSPNLRTGPAGTPSVTEGQPPAAGSLDEARAQFPDQWLMLGSAPPASATQGQDFAATAGDGEVFPAFTQYCENCNGENLNYPQLAMGALFFNVAGPNNQVGSASCSATVINSNLIVTAAHCCYNHGGGGVQPQVNTNFVFAPAYRDGAAPLGTFNGARLRMLGSYRTNPRRSNDLCVIRLQPDGQGNQVSHYTGWLGSARNMPYYQNMHAVGYPGNIGGGQFQELCTGQSFRPPQGCERANVLNMGCSMTYGSSGGAWILAYRNGNYVGSVVSGYDNEACTGPFGTGFNGPRFADNNFGALCVDGWC